MDIYNPPQQVPYLTFQGGQKFQIIKIDLPVWNMDTDDSKTVTVLNALASSLFYIAGIIFDDNGAPHNLNTLSVTAPYFCGVVNSFSQNFANVDITVQRTPLLEFDSASYDGLATSRGYIIIGQHI